MRNLPPWDNAAPTVQVSDYALSSVAIVQTIDRNLQFSVSHVDVYMAMQVVTGGGHGQHHVVEAGEYDLPIETDFAFLIYRSGTEKCPDVWRAAQDKINSDLIDGASNVEAQRWNANADGTITVSFKCGDDASNYIYSQGEE